MLQGFSLRLQQEQNQDQSDRLSTLIDISFELVLPYSELRPENSGQLTISDTFWLLTGETPSTLKLGRRVQATITGLSGQAAYCSLPDLNDMEAVILADDISSSGPVRPGDRLRRGDTVPARSACALVLQWVKMPWLHTVWLQLFCNVYCFRGDCTQSLVFPIAQLFQWDC